MASDLPWRQRPLAELLRLAGPIAVSTLSYSVMTLADTIFIGRLGPSALAGVGIGGVATFTVLCFAFGTLRGTKVLVSQAVGAGRDPSSSLDAAVSVALVLGGAMWLGGQLLAPCLGDLAATEGAGRAAIDYARIRLLGAPIVVLFAGFREFRYGLGDSRSPMVGTVAGNAVNIGLDALFILVLDWGVAGAAWASVAAQTVELSVVLAVQLRTGWRFRLPRWGSVKSLLQVGLPTGIQFELEVGSFALLTALLAGLGDRELAAHQIALQVAHFVFLPAIAVAEAASVLAGQAVGANRLRLVYGVARLAAGVTGLYGALCAVVLLVGAGVIPLAFTDDGPLRATTRSLLYVNAAFAVFDGVAISLRATLRGTGDVTVPAVIGVATAWILTPPATYLLGYVAGLGALGGWIGLLLEIVVACALFAWRLHSGRWIGPARARRRADRAVERAEARAGGRPSLAPAVA
jgi:MATE family multidrug resistance protein